MPCDYTCRILHWLPGSMIGLCNVIMIWLCCQIYLSILLGRDGWINITWNNCNSSYYIYKYGMWSISLYIIGLLSLSHPSLGWLYVFRSFPGPPRLPHSPHLLLPHWLVGIFGLIGVKSKGSELIRYWANCMCLSFDHTHNLQLEVSRSKFEIALS